MGPGSCGEKKDLMFGQKETTFGKCLITISLDMGSVSTKTNHTVAGTKSLFVKGAF